METPEQKTPKSEGTFTNTAGKKIYCRYWSEDKSDIDNTKSPKALVFITHGAAEHCLWYNDLAYRLHSKGFYVFGHDHVGHGQSEGDRVHINNFAEYNRDIFQHVDMMKKKYPTTPAFLIGHSMGGTIAILIGVERPDYFKGIILIGAAIVPDPKAASPLKIFLGKMIARILPQLPLIKLDSGLISRNGEVVKRYEDDPLVYHGGIKARWGVAFLQALKDIEVNMESIEWSFLAIHGSEDKLCAVEGSKMLFEKAKSEDKELKIYDGLFHQPHNELPEDKERTLTDITDWLLKRCL
ncbi:hypothetical protein ScPMuIL_008410 [Solemya velum]